MLTKVPSSRSDNDDESDDDESDDDESDDDESAILRVLPRPTANPPRPTAFRLPLCVLYRASVGMSMPSTSDK
jgi:hypothetical protein